MTGLRLFACVTVGIAFAALSGRGGEEPAAPAGAWVSWSDADLGIRVRVAVCQDKLALPRPPGMALRPGLPEFASAEYIVLRVETTDTWQKERGWLWPIPEWRMYVEDEKGDDVPMTLFGRRLYGVDRTSGIQTFHGHTIGVPPGGTAVTLLSNIGTQFNMSLGGIYSIVFRRTAQDNETGENRTVESPPLKVLTGRGIPLWKAMYSMAYDANRAVRREQAGVVGTFAAQVASELALAARADKDEGIRAAARAELKRLRADIDALLSGLDKATQEGAPKPAPMEQQGKEAASSRPAPAPAEQPKEPPPAPPKQ